MGVEQAIFNPNAIKTKSGYTQRNFCESCDQHCILMRQQFSHGVWHYYWACPDCNEKVSGSIARKSLIEEVADICFDKLPIWTREETDRFPPCPECGEYPRIGRKKQNDKWEAVWYCSRCSIVIAYVTPSQASRRSDQMKCLPSIDGIILNKMPYGDYLKTPHWQRVRWAAKWVSGDPPRCQLCSAEDNLQVHHRDYKRRGFERPEDLTVLCADCHTKYSLDKRAEKELVDR